MRGSRGWFGTLGLLCLLSVVGVGCVRQLQVRQPLERSPYRDWYVASGAAQISALEGRQGDAPGLSHIGRAVAAALERYRQDTGGSLSGLSWGRPGGDGSSLLIDTSPDQTRPVARTGAGFYEAVAEEVARTRERLELSTLNFTAPLQDAGSSDARSPLIEHLAPALRRLHDRVLAEGPDVPRPVVRIACSSGLFPYIGRYRILKGRALREALASAMVDGVGRPIPEAAWGFRLEVREVGWTPSPAGWNHAKIVVRDREVVLVGSQNFTNDSIDLLRPTFDLNVRLEGEIAAAASDYFARVWGEENPEKDFEGKGGQVAIFSLGRGRFPRHDGQNGSRGGARMDYSADVAMLAALSAARERIDLIQQLMVAPPAPGVYSIELFDVLARAVFRGVELRVIISPPWGIPPMFDAAVSSAEQTWRLLRDHLVRYGIEQGGLEPADAARQVSCRVQVAPFTARLKDEAGEGRADASSSASGPPPIRSHHKFFLVDDQAFYVGSQNLYPSGLKVRYPFPELGEYGVLIDDAALTARVREAQWDPLWALSAPRGYGGCPEGGPSAPSHR